jgi:NAD(P) transhydrogenase subunit alpha
MKIAIPKERRAHESRVAASPETVKKLVALGAEVAVEKGAGAGASFSDQAYKDAGADVAKDAEAAMAGAAAVLKVQRPIVGGKDDELKGYAAGTLLIANLDPYRERADMDALAKAGVTAFAMELVPRITRAQSMDVLSSQANLAGYKAVLDAAAEYGRAIPMMMTAAGRINPANVLVMGAGVAGLQAVATARRLGAVVFATDVRPASKEQVQSLGAKFVAVEDEEFKQAETAGGYAKEMSEAYKKKQADLIAETIKKQDIVITTAAIPGRPAPRLISEAMVKTMKPGAVIVDLAVETGGNCELSQPGKVVTKHGVRIVGHINVPGRLAEDASALYARNVLNLLQLVIDKETKALKIDWDDEIIKGLCVTRDGAIVHPALQGAPAPAAKAASGSQDNEKEARGNG